MLDVLSVFYEFQSTLNGGGKGEVFLIYDNITTFCQVIGSVADGLFWIVASGNLACTINQHIVSDTLDARKAL